MQVIGFEGVGEVIVNFVNSNIRIDNRSLLLSHKAHPIHELIRKNTIGDNGNIRSNLITTISNKFKLPGENEMWRMLQS